MQTVSFIENIAVEKESECMCCIQSEDERSDMNSSYSICPDPSSSISSINFSMSIVISNSCLMIRMSSAASIEPSLFDSPPKATNASRVSSSLLAP